MQYELGSQSDRGNNRKGVNCWPGSYFISSLASSVCRLLASFTAFRAGHGTAWLHSHACERLRLLPVHLSSRLASSQEISVCSVQQDAWNSVFGSLAILPWEIPSAPVADLRFARRLDRARCASARSSQEAHYQVDIPRSDRFSQPQVPNLPAAGAFATGANLFALSSTPLTPLISFFNSSIPSSVSEAVF